MNVISRVRDDLGGMRTVGVCGVWGGETVCFFLAEMEGSLRQSEEGRAGGMGWDMGVLFYSISLPVVVVFVAVCPPRSCLGILVPVSGASSSGNFASIRISSILSISSPRRTTHYLFSCFPRILRNQRKLEIYHPVIVNHISHLGLSEYAIPRSTPISTLPVLSPNPHRDCHSL